MSLPRLLFVCIVNSNRSQMAEAFARIHGAGKVEAHSSGSKPSGKVNPRAVQFMAELGYDLTTHTSKPLDQFNGTEVGSRGSAADLFLPVELGESPPRRGPPKLNARS